MSEPEPIVVHDMYHHPGNPVLRVPCPECKAESGRQCVSTLPSALGGSVGAFLKSYHAARLETLKRWAA